MFESDAHKAKTGVEVELVLHNGSVLRGVVFMGPAQRLVDLMNDQRPFLPFSDEDGGLHHH
jgi:hypothetical protein